MILFLIILIPLLLGTTSVWILERWSRRAALWGAVGISLSCVALILSQLSALDHGVIKAQLSWLPLLGINLSLRLDSLAALFGLMISGIGTLIFIYAYYYLNPKNSLAKLYSLLMLFMAAMLGISLSNNLMVLVVFWEMTSVSSFLLVSYWQRYEAAQRGARMAMLVTGFGGLCLLAGCVLLGQAAGTYQIDQILQRVGQVQSSALFWPMTLLLLMGAMTKSAQFPFHFWLPNAMAAPTPVSAYLHSATMVKAGIFLLLRLSPVFAGVAAYHQLVTVIGLVTLTLGAFFAIFKEDLKGLLAYSTISHLGLIVCLIGVGTPLAMAAAVFHLINHAAFKAALFMIAGVIDHETGTRNLRKLNQLWAVLPITGTLTMIAAAAMAGVPPTNGFVSKEMFLDVLVRSHGGLGGWLIVGIATLSAVFAVAYSLRLVHGVFFDRNRPAFVSRKAVHEPPLGMLAPVMLLTVLCIAIGLAPALLAEQVVNQVTHAATGIMPEVHLALWHGLNLPLLLSLIALVGGGVLYGLLAQGGRIRRIDLDDQLGLWRLAPLFERGLLRLFLSGRWLVRHTESGSLQQYLLWFLLSALALVSYVMMRDPLAAGQRELLYASPLAVVMWLLVPVACVMILLMHHQRIKAILMTGAVGLMVTMVFLGLSAPDLALTQITVDVVTTVLVLMGLGLLPQISPYESTLTQRWRDGLLAAVAGLGMGWLTWLVLTRDHQSISWFFMQHAAPLGGGTNVVNVILVDFRGFDTFGEICVLALAAIGALCMMDGMRMHGARAIPGLTYRFTPSPLMLRTTMSWLLPLALVVSLYIFLRGHNLPGGGFIAGLITALALIVQYIAHGQEEAERLLRANSGRLYEKYIGAGLCIAVLTGMAAWFWQRPFLTSAHEYFYLWGIGKLHLASAAAFDLGVYLVVVGSTLLFISVLGDSRHSKLSGPIRGE